MPHPKRQCNFIHQKQLSPFPDRLELPFPSEEILSGNPGPRRGNEGAFEKQVAGQWQVITLQEAIEYFDHELLTNRFHVTHYGGCAVLFKKDTFYPDIEVKSHYFHDTRRELPDKVMEGDQRWVGQGCFHVLFFRGLKTFTVLSLHMSNIYAKKRTGYCEQAHPHNQCCDAW